MSNEDEIAENEQYAEEMGEDYVRKVDSIINGFCIHKLYKFKNNDTNPYHY